MSSAEGYIEANAQEIADKILRIANEAKNEEELRIRVEHTLREVLDRLSIAWASYEFRTGKGTLVEGKRVDALYGRVVIEYEKPKTFDTTAGFEKAKKQIIDYIEDLSGKSVELYPKYFGVALDGFKIGFIRFKRGWEHQGPFDVNKQTVLKLLEAIRGLRRKPLRADLLNKDLGPESYVAKVVVNVLYQRTHCKTI
ncbi:MAG: hypothetical protein QW193_04785 [Nitrososphaerales archaeon]